MKLADGIFIVRSALTPAECGALIDRSESIGFEAAPISTSSGFERRHDTRNNARVILDDPELANMLWGRVREQVPGEIGGWHAIGLNERFRFYRYDPGQRFAIHADERYRRPNGEESRLTFMVYLADRCSGGATIFDAVRVRPQMGLALVFTHELQHEGEQVRRGRKYVLRSDVMYAPPAKV
jgi:hypothetical protein